VSLDDKVSPNDITQRVFENSEDRIRVNALLSTGSATIGNVRLQDGDSTALADIETDSSKIALFVQSESLASEATLLTRATEATQLLVKGVLDTIKTVLDTIFTRLGDRSQKTQITDGTKDVDIVTDGLIERLAVDSKVTAFPASGSPSRVEEPEQEFDGFNTTDAKINFVVPTGKKLFISVLFIALGADGGTIPVVWEADNVGFAGQAVSNDGSQSATIAGTPENPFGPFAASVEIEAERSGGDSGKNWAAGFIGYLEDE